MRKTLSRLVHSASPPLCHDVAGWARDRGLEVLEVHPLVSPPEQFPREFPDTPLYRQAFEQRRCC